MLSLIVSAAAGIAVAALVVVVTGLDAMYAPLIGTIVFAALFFILAKVFIKKVNAQVEGVQKAMMANHWDRAVQTLMDIQKKYGPWQLYLKKQMNSQIGTIYFLKKDFTKAHEYLNQGFVRHWVGTAMLAIIYMKRNQPGQMIKTFDNAVTTTRKEPLLWNLYAFCLDKIGEHAKAVEVMEKGVKKCGSHELLEANLEVLKEGKKMKMQAYGDVWFQFHLEKPGAVLRKQTKMVQGRRKIVRR
jgi:tetratricopeptide (TPR) repeat protein